MVVPLLAWLATVVLSPPLVQPEEAPADAPLTLRLRGAPLRLVVRALFELTGRSYVVDADVVGRADVELGDLSAEEIERALERLGLRFSDAGRLRRVTDGRDPALDLPGTGHEIELDLSNGDMRDVLQLMEDITGDEFLVPLGPLGKVHVYATHVPTEDLLSAALASVGLAYERQGSRVLVSHPGERGATLLAPRSGRHYGHVPYRAGEVVPQLRPAGIHGVLGRELRFMGVVGRGTRWLAVTTDHWLVPEGTVLYDGRIESVGPEGSLVRLDTGGALAWSIEPAAPGIRLLPEGVDEAIERGAAALGRRNFDEAEGILHAAMTTAKVGEDAARARAALADLHFEWGQTLLVRQAVTRAVRQFEAAYELDRLERPWQAGEDLNEIGFAWAALGEPERAVDPHRRALELVRTADLSNEPGGPGCVRSHPRSAWIEPSALNGLANAARVAGRLREARELYERALPLWQGVADAAGASAALTGLGLVEQALGRPAQAAALHERALGVPALEPAHRAPILNNLAGALLASGRPDEAKANFELALAAYRQLGDRGGEGTVLDNLGTLYESRGSIAEACARYAEALAASREADDRRGQALTLARIEHLAASADDEAATCRAALATDR